MRSLLALAALSAASPALAWEVTYDDIESICTWNDARWERSATLLLPGTQIPIARVWRGDDVKLTGALGMDLWYRMRLRVALAGPGLAVGGDIDPNEDWVFSLDADARPMGPIATLVRGGKFEITEPGHEVGVVVVPDAYAAEDVWTPTAWTVLPCEDITVHWRPVPDEARMLKAIGFPADARTMSLPRRRSARLYAGSDGPLQGVIQGAKYARTVRVAEERDGRAHIALPDWTGTVWHGWVDVRRLVEPAKGGTSDLLGGIGGLPAGEITVRRCEMDAPLRVWARGRSIEIGRVSAGTPFEVLSAREGWWSVRFPGGWIEPHEKTPLTMAADSSRCTEGLLTWPATRGLEDLFTDDALPEDVTEPAPPAPIE